MSNAKSIFIGGLMMILISNIVLSTDYYINSSEGNDANDGVTAPWKTIANKTNCYVRWN